MPDTGKEDVVSTYNLDQERPSLSDQERLSWRHARSQMSGSPNERTELRDAIQHSSNTKSALLRPHILINYPTDQPTSSLQPSQSRTLAANKRSTTVPNGPGKSIFSEPRVIRRSWRVVDRSQSPPIDCQQCIDTEKAKFSPRGGLKNRYFATDQLDGTTGTSQPQ
jgi:hypothetical protein